MKHLLRLVAITAVAVVVLGGVGLTSAFVIPSLTWPGSLPSQAPSWMQQRFDDWAASNHDLVTLDEAAVIARKLAKDDSNVPVTDLLRQNQQQTAAAFNQLYAVHPELKSQTTRHVDSTQIALAHQSTYPLSLVVVLHSTDTTKGADGKTETSKTITFYVLQKEDTHSQWVIGLKTSGSNIQLHLATLPSGYLALPYDATARQRLDEDASGAFTLLLHGEDRINSGLPPTTSVVETAAIGTHQESADALNAQKNLGWYWIFSRRELTTGHHPIPVPIKDGSYLTFGSDQVTTDIRAAKAFCFQVDQLGQYFDPSFPVGRYKGALFESLENQAFIYRTQPKPSITPLARTVWAPTYDNPGC
jgi:hypothetical protein